MAKNIMPLSLRALAGTTSSWKPHQWSQWNVVSVRSPSSCTTRKRPRETQSSPRAGAAAHLLNVQDGPVDVHFRAVPADPEFCERPDIPDGSPLKPSQPQFTSQPSRLCSEVPAPHFLAAMQSRKKISTLNHLWKGWAPLLSFLTEYRQGVHGTEIHS